MDKPLIFIFCIAVPPLVIPFIWIAGLISYRCELDARTELPFQQMLREPSAVKRYDLSIQNQPYHAVELEWSDYFLPSGPPIYIYNAQGRCVDYCPDIGENNTFVREWGLNDSAITADTVLKHVRN